MEPFREFRLLSANSAFSLPVPEVYQSRKDRFSVQTLIATLANGKNGSAIVNRTVRIFIAINLPLVIKQAVQVLQDSLRDCPASIAWTPSENLHLTLKFLGEIDDRAVESVTEIVESISIYRRRLTLSLNQTGVFPNPRNPRILWIGMGGQVKELAQMAALLDQSLTQIGFVAETRPYQPHLTIGRFKSPTGVTELIERAATAEICTDPFEVNELIVMRSILQPGGSSYIPLHTFPLAR